MRATYSHFWRIGAIRLGASALLCAVLGNTVSAQIVYPAPPLVLQDVQWTSGTHHYSQSPAIVAPDDPGHPVEVSGTADAEFVSGTAVHLTDGFQAGSFTGDGQFRARIGDQYGDPESIVLIPSEPGAQTVDGVVHVPKWEKLEIGIELPPAYQAAVDSFFAHYYSNGQNEPATSGAIDTSHDLNPYADDSLQLVMTLTKPSGTQTLKWGFFMREADWIDDGDFAILAEDPLDTLAPYQIRFRLSPDEEGIWGFSVAISAPATVDSADVSLPTILYTDYSFHCESALPDNHGPLHVHPINRRVLQFEDGTTFFGLGPNMADKGGSEGTTLFRRDLETMKRTMEELNSVGGNFMRMWLLREIFSPEQVNLGVYDAYRYKKRSNCPYESEYAGNGQFNCWAFDQLVDQARLSEIMIQLCIHPYPPGSSGETYLWNADPLYINFLNKERDPITERFDMKEYFYTPDTVSGTRLLDQGAFYYWKRRYKYVLSRWGYSVNIPIIEPFNEIDQMLTYQYHNLTGHGNNSSICTINQREWPLDTLLPVTLSDWLTDISSFVRDSAVVNSPHNSPLGESKKLFLMSYAWNEPWREDRESFYKPFYNPKVDLLDVHMYLYPNDEHINQPDDHIHRNIEHTHYFIDQFQSTWTMKKPFVTGEFNYFPSVSNNNFEQYFHNVELSFHNELWSTAFSGTFAAGNSWLWSRLFWWPDAVPAPPRDDFNPYQQFFSDSLGATNSIWVGGEAIEITNRRAHHHFRPLADLLNHPSLVGSGFFDQEYGPHKVFDESGSNAIETYYLKSADSAMALGWIHNRNAWVMNNFYFKTAAPLENYYGCIATNTDTISLHGFIPNTDYHITWFPTWVNSEVQPLDTVWPSTATGDLLLDLSTAPFGDTISHFLDTLHADYAFIISPEPFAKSFRPTAYTNDADIESAWDFLLFPNPASDAFFLRLPDDTTNEVVVLDVAGRIVLRRANWSGRLLRLPTSGIAMGAYWVRVRNGMNEKTKKLIIH